MGEVGRGLRLLRLLRAPTASAQQRPGPFYLILPAPPHPLFARASRHRASPRPVLAPRALIRNGNHERTDNAARCPCHPLRAPPPSQMGEVGRGLRLLPPSPTLDDERSRHEREGERVALTLPSPIALAALGQQERGSGLASAHGREGLQTHCPNRLVCANMPLSSKWPSASSTDEKTRVAVSVMKGEGALRGFHTT